MSFKKVLLALGLAAVIASAAVTANVAFAQSEDPPIYPENQSFMTQRSMRWMSERTDGWMAEELGDVMHDAMIAAFADALELEPAELEARLEAGEQMIDIALAEGLSTEDVWEIMETVREDAREAVLDSGIEFPTFRERTPDNVLFDCDEECDMDARSARRGGRGGSLAESRLSDR